MRRTKRPAPWWQRFVATGAFGAAVGLAIGLVPVTTSVASAASSGQQAAEIRSIVRSAMAADHLRSVIVRVTVGNTPVITQAFGSSLTGVPATTSMNFRNGAVAFSYVATLLMEFVDEHKLSLSDPISKWEPTLPEASQVTVKMLANMTSGYPDYVTDPAFLAAFNADRHRRRGHVCPGRVRRRGQLRQFQRRHLPCHREIPGPERGTAAGSELVIRPPC